MDDLTDFLIPDPLATECLHYLVERVGSWDFYHGLADEMAAFLRQGKVVVCRVELGEVWGKQVKVMRLEVRGIKS